LRLDLLMANTNVDNVADLHAALLSSEVEGITLADGVYDLTPYHKHVLNEGLPPTHNDRNPVVDIPVEAGPKIVRANRRRATIHGNLYAWGNLTLSGVLHRPLVNEELAEARGNHPPGLVVRGVVNLIDGYECRGPSYGGLYLASDSSGCFVGPGSIFWDHGLRLGMAPYGHGAYIQGQGHTLDGLVSMKARRTALKFWSTGGVSATLKNSILADGDYRAGLFSANPLEGSVLNTWDVNFFHRSSHMIPTPQKSIGDEGFNFEDNILFKGGDPLLALGVGEPGGPLRLKRNRIFTPRSLARVELGAIIEAEGNVAWTGSPTFLGPGQPPPGFEILSWYDDYPNKRYIKLIDYAPGVEALVGVLDFQHRSSIFLDELSPEWAGKQVRAREITSNGVIWSGTVPDPVAGIGIYHFFGKYSRLLTVLRLEAI
jgi:hypothetical protein